MAQPVILRAPAKLTLTLRVTGRRPDGYHLIAADMVTLALHDVLTIDSSGDGISVSGPYGDGIPTDGTNLVARALELVGRRAHVHIDKHIPHGGGLGGGSADAAAILRWAGYTDVAGAAAIGADVPFCLVGGAARVSGIGDVVEPTDRTERIFTLVIPPLACPTAAVYRAWDALGGPVGDYDNDLEPAAIEEVPTLSAWRDRITAAAGTRPRLAGSGSTWFLDGRHDDLAAQLSGANVVVTRTDRP